MAAFFRILIATLVFTASLTGSAAFARGSKTVEPPTKQYTVKAYRDVTYLDMRHDPDRNRHQLDVYCPKGQTKCPVLFFVHGGAWTISSKDDVFGIYGYGTIGKCFAERGMVVVMPNYRLSPGVKHPEHIKDVARAFAWTCQNIADYGGDPEQIIVAGHSAGGHLVALLATDPSYLQAVGHSPKDIQGVIGISGVYNVEHLDLKELLGCQCRCVDFPDKVNPIVSVFGTEPGVLKQASPIGHVRPGLPPFLLLNAGLDYAPLRDMTKEFAACLKANGCEVQTAVIRWRTHETEVFDIPRLTAEPKMVEAVVGFVERTKAGTVNKRP